MRKSFDCEQLFSTIVKKKHSTTFLNGFKHRTLQDIHTVQLLLKASSDTFFLPSLPVKLLGSYFQINPQIVSI